jgi:hypothetical protein
LFRIIEDLVKWENTNNEEVLQKARDEIWRSWRYTYAENADHPRLRWRSRWRWRRATLFAKYVGQMPGQCHSDGPAGGAGGQQDFARQSFRQARWHGGAHLWGELAWQLGGKQAYARVRADDEKATSPGDMQRELFHEYGRA